MAWLTIAIKLLPTDSQSAALHDTLERANRAANVMSGVAWQQRTFGQFKLHKLVYASTRASSGLSAQVVVRVIAKVADAYKLDRERKRSFAALGSLAYDERILRYGAEHVSIWTTSGRQSIGFVCNAYQRRLLAQRQGESDLVYRDGKWFLYATVNVVEAAAFEASDVLGVDLGINNIAADSDGTFYSGGHVTGLRYRHRRLRRRLQHKGTRSAKRLLKVRRRREQRFATNINHTISKRIVAEGSMHAACDRTRRPRGHPHADQGSAAPAGHVALLVVLQVAPLRRLQGGPGGCPGGLCRSEEHQSHVPCLRSGGRAQSSIASAFRVCSVWLRWVGMPTLSRPRTFVFAVGASVMRPYAAGAGSSVSKLLAANAAS